MSFIWNFLINCLISIYTLKPAELSPEPFSLVTHTQLDEFVPAPKRPQPGVVSWCPPQPNWNPWTNCNIDEGPLAHVSKKKNLILWVSVCVCKRVPCVSKIKEYRWWWYERNGSKLNVVCAILVFCQEVRVHLSRFFN